jgi:hypothetical protein
MVGKLLLSEQLDFAHPQITNGGDGTVILAAIQQVARPLDSIMHLTISCERDRSSYNSPFGAVNFILKTIRSNKCT